VNTSLRANFHLGFVSVARLFPAWVSAAILGRRHRINTIGGINEKEKQKDGDSESQSSSEIFVHSSVSTKLFGGMVLGPYGLSTVHIGESPTAPIGRTAG